MTGLITSCRGVSIPRKYRKHFCIPDPQVKPGVPTSHIAAAGRYAAEKRPEVIVILGDWWDMPSLSAWDSPTKKAENKVTYCADIEVGRKALDSFLRPLRPIRSYSPELHFCVGNHEARITRYVDDNPVLRATLGLHALGLVERGFKVHPFLKPTVIDGIAYAHYFNVSSNGRVMNSKHGQASARAQVQNVGMTAIAGHKQGLDTYIKECPAGRMRGVIAGSFYQHDEEYLGPQGNSHWQGTLMLHEVHDGDFDLMEVSLGFLLRKYT